MDISSELEATKFFNRTNPKAFTDVKTTPVILVCIYNKNSTLITHDLLYNVFSAYGKILRILIFEKVKVWKAFIEFSNVEEAIEAKRNLNDFLLFSDGTRINIYPSNLEHVKFQNNNSGGVDYTLTEQPDLSQFKDQFPLPVPEATGNAQPEAPPTFQNQFPTDTNNNYDSIAERSNSTNSQSQPNSGKLKWPVPEAEDQEERFQNQPHEHNQDNDVSPYGQDYHQNENYEEGQFSHKLFNDAFPSSSWNTQDIGYKRKTQALQLNSPAFQDPNQPIKQPPPMQNQNPNSFWPQGMPNNNMNNLGNMQQNMNNFGNMQSHNLNNLGNMQSNTNIQMPVNNSAPPGLVRMTNANSFTNIPIRQNPQQLSRNNTFTDLPPPSNPMNPGPGPGPNRGLLPRFATLNDLPKSSNTMMKPGLPQFGSVTDLGGFGMGGMNQGMNQRMNPGLGQGLQQGPPQLNKPMLNSRFGSTPELPMMSEISKYKLDSMSTQSLRDLIERDILIRLMMNQIQNESGDLMQQNNNLINDLNDIKKYSPALPGVGDVDYNDLTKMNKTTLDQIYQDLSNILGKTIENKECAVLYVKGLEHKDIKVRMLYNIFSNFGNIKKIIFIRRQAAALIEYETVEYAAKAKEDLSNIVFMGKPLRIYYSFHPIINLKNKKNGKDASEEIFIGTPKTFRFGKAKTISMNPPSATIHVSNLTKEVCNEDTMRNFFSPFGRIEAIQIKCMENNRNMCLIRMASMEESLNAMAYLHDVELGGRPVQISFTKSKI